MAPPPSALPIYPIGVVRKVTGLTERQIRHYEKMGLLKPARSPGRHRLFSAADVERLNQIKRLMQRGLSLRAVHAYLATHDRVEQGERLDIEKDLPEHGDIRARFAKPSGLAPQQRVTPQPPTRPLASPGRMRDEETR